MTDGVQYYAAWAADPTVEHPSGDMLEAAKRVSHVADLRQEREEQQRRDELEEPAEQRLRDAPTMSELFARVERQVRAEDYRADRADERERQRLAETGGYEKPPSDLVDLKLKSRRDAKEYPRKGSLRWLRDKSAGRPTEPEPKASAPPSQASTPHAPQRWPKWR
jgi:hypothetical protein